MAKEQIGTFRWSSYNQLVEHKVDFDELIYVLSPIDLPLLTGAGSNGGMVLPRLPVTNRTFWWQDEDVPLPRGTLSEAGFDNIETDLTVGTGEAVKFPVGSTIRVDDEAMKVTAINTSTDVLTVTRGALGTAAAAHSQNAEVIGIGTALPEGDVGEAAFRGRDKYSNYTQIFSRKFGVTNTELLIPKYGVPSELARQTVNVGQHLNTEIENAALYGIRYNDDASQTRSTGGAAHFITSNVDTDDVWLTVDLVQTRQQNAYNAGGLFNVLLAQPGAFKALDNITDTGRVQSVTIEDSRRGRMRAEVIMTQYGPVQIVRDRWCRATHAFGLVRENFILRVMRPMSLTGLAKTDDRENYLMVAEVGFQVKGQEHMARWTGLDQTQALPGSGLV